MTHFLENIITERNSALRRKMKPFLEICEILNWYIFSFKSFVLLKKKIVMLRMGWPWEFGVESFQMEMSHASLGITKIYINSQYS